MRTDIRKRRTINNIILLSIAVLMVLFTLCGCTKEEEPESYPEAEAAVKAELDSFKNAETNDKAFEEFMKAAGDFEDGSMIEGYIDKVKQFDYEILGSTRVGEAEDNVVSVRVKISTYDFANEYLKAWNEFMEVDESNRWQSQFYSNLLLRLASVSRKDYISEVEVLCADSDGSGKWTTDFKTNEDLMDALSGGMLTEIKNLMTDDVIMDESERE